jgi:hypothetical protein
MEKLRLWPNGVPWNEVSAVVSFAHMIVVADIYL